MRGAHPRTAAVAAVALAVALGGCMKTTRTAGPASQIPLPTDTMTVAVDEIGSYGGRFVLAQTNSPRTFNVVMANETSSTDLCNGRLFESLVGFNNATQLQEPSLAKSWEASDDSLTWTFHLRRGAAFSDGHPLTAEDVLFSLEVYMDDTIHVSLYDFFFVNGKKYEVSAPDSFTVQVKIAGPSAMLIPTIGSAYILPKHVLEPAYRQGRFRSAYGTNTPPDSLVTSGPWRLKEYRPNEKTVLTRNPYWCGVDPQGNRLPYLDELVFLIVPDQSSAALKFEAGEVDALDDVTPENYADYTRNQETGNFTLYDLGPALNTNFLWFNLNKVREPVSGKKLGQPHVDATKYAWFSQRDFRRAVSMAIDRDAIIKSVYHGHAVKNWSTITPGNTQWHTPDVVRWDYAPEESKQLLAGLGWKDKDGDGFLEDQRGNTISFTIKTNSSNQLRVRMLNFIRDDLAKVGIKVIGAPTEFNTLITSLRQDFQYESILLGLQSGVPPDPGMGQNVWKSSGLTHYWNIKQPRPETEAEARADRLMAENLATFDIAARKRTWKGIQDAINEECFVVWLPTLVAKIPVRNRFGNLHPSIIPHRLIWNIDEVFVKKGGQRA